MKNRLDLIGSLLALPFLCAIGCRPAPAPNIQPEMKDAYVAVQELYHYVWKSSQFFSPEAEKTISALLERLSKDFHRIERKTPDRNTDPGFEIVLKINQDLLRDTQKRFAAGAKEYAHWRLRGLLDGCISCHSRYAVRADFLGAESDIPRTNYEEKLLAAEFLFASRQFDKSADELFAIAKETGKTRDDSGKAFRALKLWLVIVVRVKEQFLPSAKSLQALVKQSKLLPEHRIIINQWIKDLRGLEGRKVDLQPLQEAKYLLRGVSELSTVQDDDGALVRTLRATSLLHPYLNGTKLPEAERREGTYLLAVGYDHIQIQNFEVSRDLYLEQCIREFPRSSEAQGAYGLYKEELEFRFSGSGGLHLEDKDRELLNELHKLAYGTMERSDVKEKE